MKVKEIDFSIPIDEQLEEIEAWSLIKNHSAEQHYAFFLLSVPIYQRQLLKPSEEEKLSY